MCFHFLVFISMVVHSRGLLDVSCNGKVAGLCIEDSGRLFYSYQDGWAPLKLLPARKNVSGFHLVIRTNQVLIVVLITGDVQTNGSCFESHQPVSVWLKSVNEQRCTGVQMTGTSKCEFLKVKKKKREKNSDRADERRKWLPASARRDRAAWSTSIRRSRAGLWLHSCYCQQTVNLPQMLVWVEQSKVEQKWNLPRPHAATALLICGLCGQVHEMGRLEGICLLHDGCGLFVQWKTDGV